MLAKPEQICVAIRDDYQNVAPQWRTGQRSKGRATTTVFNDHRDGTDAVSGAFSPSTSSV